MPAKSRSGNTGNNKSRTQVRIIWTDDSLTQGFQKYPEALDKAISEFMDYQSTSVEDYAKANAPWSDRTTNARNGLKAEQYEDGSKFGVVLYHTMPYGIWLEVANSGKYRVIVPTIIDEGQRIMGSLGRFLQKVDFT